MLSSYATDMVKKKDGKAVFSRGYQAESLLRNLAVLFGNGTVRRVTYECLRRGDADKGADRLIAA